MTQTTAPAIHADITQMIAVCAQNLIENNREKLSADDFSKKGFLVRKLTKEDVEEMLADQKNHFACVVKEGEKVLGYLTGCDAAKSGIDFSKHAPDLQKITKLFYHKQIVKVLEAKNVGTKLLFTMFNEAKSRGYSHVICRIVHKPFFNQASISFHEKFGFKEIGAMEENGLTLGIYLLNLVSTIK